jgi:hypothetical protein
MCFKEECLRKLSYDPKTGVFTWNFDGTRGVKAGDVAGSKTSDGYIKLSIKGKRLLAHRAAWLFVNGQFPDGHIDHINRIKSDNRIANLRSASKAQNAQNREKNSRNTSGYKGVTWHKRDKMWQAAITVFGKRKHLGYYKELKEAFSAYIAASKKYQTHSIFKES